MHVGTHFTLFEVIFWTRRDLTQHLVWATIPSVLYIEFGWHWLGVPWLPIALLGTAVAFVVGFKNNASYDRVWEARRIWGSIVNASRTWGIMVRDYVSLSHHKGSKNQLQLEAVHAEIFNRHFAWLTALRYQLREKRNWESVYKKHNAEFKNKWFKIDEHENKMETALKPYLSRDEYHQIINKTNKAAQILALQSAHLKRLLDDGLIEDFRHVELMEMLQELYNQQGASERIKNFPYPRQYATTNLWFIKIFVLLIPLGMLQEFQKLGGNLIWLSIPFSALCGWIFTTLEKIGEASESPFEGSANDVPITSMSRAIEIDMREMIGQTQLPEPIKPSNNIIS